MLAYTWQHADPDTTYASSRADAAFVESLQAPLPDPSSFRQPRSFIVKLKKASLFDASRGLGMLSNLNIHGMPSGRVHTCCPQIGTAQALLSEQAVAGLSASERQRLISGMVSITSPQQLGALGALLTILQEVLGSGSFSRRAPLHLPDCTMACRKAWYMRTETASSCKRSMRFASMACYWQMQTLCAPSRYSRYRLRCCAGLGLPLAAQPCRAPSMACQRTMHAHC